MIDVRLKERSELHRVTLNTAPISLKDPKLLAVPPPHVDMTVQLMKLSLLVHWYEAISVEHTGPGPTSCVDWLDTTGEYIILVVVVSQLFYYFRIMNTKLLLFNRF